MIIFLRYLSGVSVAQDRDLPPAECSVLTFKSFFFFCYSKGNEPTHCSPMFWSRALCFDGVRFSCGFLTAVRGFPPGLMSASPLEPGYRLCGIFLTHV